LLYTADVWGCWWNGWKVTRDVLPSQASGTKVVAILGRFYRILLVLDISAILCRLCHLLSLLVMKNI
jgi:hypothetical protein